MSLLDGRESGIVSQIISSTVTVTIIHNNLLCSHIISYPHWTLTKAKSSFNLSAHDLMATLTMVWNNASILSLLPSPWACFHSWHAGSVNSQSIVRAITSGQLVETQRGRQQITAQTQKGWEIRWKSDYVQMSMRMQISHKGYERKDKGGWQGCF